MSLAAARQRRDASREMIAAGTDPRNPTSTHPSGPQDRLRAVAPRWMDAQTYWTERHRGHVAGRLRQDVYPALGNRPIREISGADVLAVIRAIDNRDALHTAMKVRGDLRGIFAFGIAEGRAISNPAVEVAAATKSVRRTVHRKMIPDLAEFMRRLYDYKGEPMTAIAIEVTLRTALRTSEIRFATRAEIEADVWRKPPEHMKGHLPHLVPIVPQVRLLLQRAIEIGGETDLLFRGDLDPSRPMSQNTMLFALYRMGYRGQATMHGMRRNFSTAANESGLFEPDWVEAQLAHADADKIRATYNAALYLPHRRRLIEWWNDHLDRAAISNLL